MKQLNKLSPVTLQQQLRDEIVSGIRNGTWCPGDQIPTEYELSKMYDVSRVTVRGAISQLVSENILVRKAGKGTFVKEAAPYQEGINMGSSFSANCLSRNVRPSTVIARHSIRKAEGEESGLADDNGNILEIIRIRLVDDDPCIVEVDCVPTSFSFLLDDQPESKSFIRTIEKRTGAHADQFIDRFTIEKASKEFANYLHCPVRTPLLKVMQVVNTPDGKPLYRNDQYILTSKYIYVKS